MGEPRGSREGVSITTIIAAKTAGGVDLGWDSKVSPRGVARKVVSVNKQFYVGVAGYSRYADILKFAPVPAVHEAEFQAEGFDPYPYLVNDVVPAWHDALKNGYREDPDTKDDWAKGSVLAVIRGRIFSFDSLLSVTEFEDYAGIGSGSGFALGALAAGKNVQKALEIASDLDSGTGGELHVIKGLK